MLNIGVMCHTAQQKNPYDIWEATSLNEFYYQQVM